MMIEVVDTWKQTIPARTAKKWTGDDGKERNIEAAPERQGQVALARASDGQVNLIEIPQGYTTPVKAGDSILAEIKDWPERPLRLGQINRHVAGTGK